MNTKKIDPHRLFYKLNNMKYGQIAGNRHLNRLIYRCFEYICEEDERKCVKKLREQPSTSDEIMHTVRELILGAYLGSSGFKVRYDCTVDTQTPDWCILDGMSALLGIIELVNFHIDKTTEQQVEKQWQAKGMAIYWRDGNKDNVDRLYRSMLHKAQVYKALVQNLRVPYVIAVFSDFRAAIDSEEIYACLFAKEFGLFEICPEVSGMLYFVETSGRYLFRFTRNPTALRVFDLPHGFFPPEG